MKLNQLHRAALACAGAISFYVATTLAFADEAKRPNVVVILIDAMGFSDLGYYSGELPTPNINRMAKKGVRFTQFYNTARCSPRVPRF